MSAFSAYEIPRELPVLSQSPTWPSKPNPAVFTGLPGDIVKTLEPSTEADPLGLLMQLLIAAGSVMGRGVYALVGATKHYLNEFAVLVGATAKARKGTSWAPIESIFSSLDPDFSKNRLARGGLSSGEGLIHRVRDPLLVTSRNKEGKEETKIVDEGVSDKRLIVVEGEFGSVLKVLRRDGNTLSPLLRNSWDGCDLQTLTRHEPLRATSPHISVVGHITEHEVKRNLTTGEMANGFANRFLWVCVRRSKLLPSGGSPDPTTALERQLRSRIDAARTRGAITRSKAAEKLWRRIYREMSMEMPGLLGDVTARGEAHVLRLSALYAVLDGRKQIRTEHIRAAYALWQYCVDSAAYIFGNSTGDVVADKILEALRTSSSGLCRTDISKALGRNQSGEKIQRALMFLSSIGLAVRLQTPGTRKETWDVPNKARDTRKGNAK